MSQFSVPEVFIDAHQTIYFEKTNSIILNCLLRNRSEHVLCILGLITQSNEFALSRTRQLTVRSRYHNAQVLINYHTEL